MNKGILLTTLMALLPATANADPAALTADLTNAAVYKYMVADRYVNWAPLPGTKAQHTDPPNSHNNYLTVLVNGIALEYLTANSPFTFKPYEDAAGSNFLNLPAGSMIYKLAYKNQGEPPSGGPVVMYKVPAEQLKTCGYPQCQNGWLFTYIDVTVGSKEPPRNPGLYTDGQACVACHTGAYSADAGAQDHYSSAKYMLSEADYVWSVFYQMVQKLD